MDEGVGTERETEGRGRDGRLSALVEVLHEAAAAHDDVQDLVAEALAAFLAERDMGEVPPVGPAGAGALAMRAVLDACGPQDRGSLRALCALAGMSGTMGLARLRGDVHDVGEALEFETARRDAVARCLVTGATVEGGRTRFRAGRLPPRAPLPAVHPALGVIGGIRTRAEIAAAARLARGEEVGAGEVDAARAILALLDVPSG